MLVHCPRCDVRAMLIDGGVVRRPTCLECGVPLPMPSAQPVMLAGPMSPLPGPTRTGRPQPRMHA